MTPQVLLLTVVALVVGGVLTLAIWLRRRYHVRWSTWWWGALAFVASQALRVPLLTSINNVASGLPAATIATIALVAALITSGLFEETSRWVVLKYLAKRDRGRPDGLMFGAGHAGIEAILLVAAGAVSGLVLLTLGPTIIEQMRSSAPGQVALVQGQLETLRNLSPVDALLGVWERVPATAFHIAATLAVLRSVRERRLSWLWIAIVAHILFNTVAITLLRGTGSVLLVEVALTVIGAGMVWVIVRGWGAARHFPPLPPGPTRQVPAA